MLFFIDHDVHKFKKYDFKLISTFLNYIYNLFKIVFL